MSYSLRILPYKEAKYQVFDDDQLLATFTSVSDAIEYIRQTEDTKPAQTPVYEYETVGAQAANEDITHPAA